MLEPIIAPSTGVSLLMSEAFSKGVVPVSARMRPDPHQLEPLEMMTTPWLLPFLSSPESTQTRPHQRRSHDVGYSSLTKEAWVRRTRR